MESGTAQVSEESSKRHAPEGLGAALREARVASGLSLEDAARRCLLSTSQIAGLESGESRAFYSPEYARRAAQRYAALLGLEATPEPPRPPEPPPAAPAESQAGDTSGTGRLRLPVSPAGHGLRNLALVAGGAAVVATILFLNRDASSPVAAPAGNAAVAARPAAASPAPAGAPAMPPGADGFTAPTPSSDGRLPAGTVAPGVAESATASSPEAAPRPAQAEPAPAGPPRRSPRRLYVLAIRGTPLRIRDAAGQVLHDGPVSPGFSRSFEGEPPFTVEAAAPDPLEVYYLGRRVRLQPGDSGRSAATVSAPRGAR